MTKKIFLGMSAMAMLFATSCKDDFAESFVGDQATVEFSISTPEIGTRAYSDGETADVLQYAVYDEAGKKLSLGGKTNLINKAATVSLELTTGESYSVIFWAAAEGAPYTVDFDKKTMTVNYTGAKSNDERRDAFYKYHTFTVSGAQTETIELRRPFAQLNIGTSDYAAATATNYNPTQSKVTVKNIYNTLNLATGAVSGEEEVVFGYANINRGETFPVVGYEYLAMNYLLVPADQEVVDIEFGYKGDNDAEHTRTVGSVPVQRNYRTNIYGKLLTSEVDVKVEIKPGFDEPDYTVKTADELKVAIETAIASGQNANIELTSDIALAETLVIAAPTTRSTSATPAITIEIDGKCKTLYYSGVEGRAIDVKAESNGVNLTLKNLTIDCTASYCQRGINYNTNGTLELDGVTVKGTNVTYALNLPGSSDNAVVTINNSNLSGNIALNVWGENSVINATNTVFTSVDKSTAEGYSAIALNNDGAGNVANGTVVTINGGKIIAKDENGELSNAVRNATKTGRVDISNTTEVVGNTKEPVVNVIYEGSNQFYSFTTLQEAINKVQKDKNGKVRLIKDITLDEPVELVASDYTVVLDLNGKTITANTEYAIMNDKGGNLEIKNGTINGVIYNETGKTTITSGTFNALDGGKYVLLNSKGTLEINGGTINGGSSYPVYSYDADNKLVINDATVNATFGCVNAYGTGGVVEINGGTFQMTGVKGKTSHIAYFSNVDATINGGTFEKVGDINMSGAGGGGICAIYGANLTINDGTFAGDYADVYDWGGKNANGRSVGISINGGTYKFKPNNVAEGHAATQNADGTWTVK